MKKFIVLIGMLSFIYLSHSQNRVTFTENFDGKTHSFSTLPATAWASEDVLSVDGNSCWGFIPDAEGDSAVLLSPIYDLQSYEYVYLRFTHICKILESDIATIEYREDYVGARWTKIPIISYEGKSILYRKRQVFNDNSYEVWQSNDIHAEPDNSWWRTESFDISQEVSFAKVQFRFKIVKGSKVGSQFAWGWLIDNFELFAADHEINPPAVELVEPLVKGSVFGAGPFQIIAKAASRTLLPLQTPILRMKYKAADGTETKDSTLMTLIEGDTIWMGVIPQQLIGTHVDYAVYATDSVGNNATVNSSYFINRKWGFDSNSVAITKIDTPGVGAIAGVQTPVVVTIENRGLKTLSSATLHWRLNGVLQNSVNWTGTLIEGFSTQVPLGSYLPQLEKYDTITAWVSMPNNEPNASSDTIAYRVSYGCNAILSGNYTVGPTGYFTDIDEALSIMKTCGTAGNVTLQLESGTYTKPIKLVDLNYYTGAYDLLTITSLSGNVEDVILQSDGSEAMIIEIARSHNVVISNLTIDVTTAYQGVAITDTVYNIEINNCHILLDTMGKTVTHGILKKQNTGLFDRLRIVNNVINGGYYGIYLCGVDNFTYNTNLYIDNNIIKNAFHTAIYLRHNQFYSISENQITSRVNYVGSLFNAIYAYYCHGTYILKNKIRSYRTINQVTAMETMYLNYLDTVNYVLIANNEIIIHCNSSAGGALGRASGSGVLSLSYASAEVIHNSILKTGLGDFAAINVSNPTYLNLRNNNIVTENGYPIKCAANTPFGTQVFMDYNNYFSMIGNYVGINGTAVGPNITTWTLSTGQDSNSVSMLPAYIDTAKHLRLTNYLNLEAPIYILVNDDISDSLRLGITAMGCYTPPQLPFDIMLIGLHNWTSSTNANQTTDAIAKFINISSIDTLKSMTINWSVNGVMQTPYTWTGSLLPYMSDTVDLGSFLPQSENNDIKVWLSAPNNQVSDMNTDNDTIVDFIYGCNMPLSGTYSVGTQTSDFMTPDEAMQVANFCGINSPVTFVLAPRVYPELSLKGIVPGSDSVNTITFTSNHRDSTIFKGMDEIVTLTGVAHLNFENLTIDAYDANKAIVFYGASQNISIRDCRIVLDPTTKEQQFGIDLNNTSAISDNFRIINNYIDGGYNGIRFVGGSATTGSSTRFVIDSNTLTNQYYCPIYSSYTNYERISNNVIKARTSYVITTTSHSMYIMQAVINEISNNKIYSFSDKISTVYGIRLNAINATASFPVLVANNEIILYASTANIFGLHTTNCQSDIYHNSVLIKGIGDGKAYALVNSAHDYNIKNNNFITLAGANTYPIHLNAVTNLSMWDIDYNNYYTSGNFIGYAGANKTTLADWQATVTSDQHSVNVFPDFVDANLNSLQYYSNTQLIFSSLANVPTDINNENRNTTTHVGAYKGAAFGYNAKLVNFSLPKDLTTSPNATVDVSVTLQNRSDSVLRNVTIDWEANGIGQTPIQWTGNLSPNATDNVYLGSFTATTNENTLLAYTSMPNGHPDQANADDTIRYHIYGCASPLNGSFTVGGSSADFPTINAAIATLYACGVNGPVTLQIANGKYDEINLSGAITGASVTNTITFVAASGNANDVVIGEMPLSGKSITLTNAAHLKFKHLSIGATDQDVVAGVEILGTLTNVSFDSCKIMSTMGGSGIAYAAIHRDAAALGANVTDLTIDNCILQGGYLNVYLTYCGTSVSNYGKITINNSQLIDAAYGGIQALQGYFVLTLKDNYFVNYKEITSYTALQLGNAIAYVDIDSCVRNKVRLNATSSNIAFTIGSNVNRTSGVLNKSAYIANNEIFITAGTSQAYAFTLQTTSNVNIFGNSIYIDVAATNAYGFSITNSTANYKCAFKYNNLYIKNTTGNAYMYYSANNINWSSVYFDIDYNNYYGNVPFAAYASASQSYKSLKEWQIANFQDLNSTTEKVNFNNLPYSLASDGKKAIIPANTELLYDINHQARISYTNAGCYHNFVAPAYDAKLAAIVSPSDGILTGNSAVVGVKIENIGSQLDSCEIHWKINGVTQAPYHWYATPPLAFGTLSDSIFIGSFIAHSGANYIEVWTSKPNGQADGNPFNDTLRMAITSCDSSLQGKYTVGTPNADFTSLEDAISKITTCAIAGPVVFELAAGEYPAIEIKNPIQGASNINTVTFTSEKGRVYDVIIGGNADVGVGLKNTGHLRFENLTIGSVNPSTMYGVKFDGYCEDITIYACNVYANASATTGPAAIYYANAASTINYLKDIAIVKNNIQGGVHNIYLAYAAGHKNNTLASAANRSSIRIDSNLFSNAYTYAIWVNQVCYSPSISYNTIAHRSSSTTFNAIYLTNYVTADKIVGNTIYLKNSSTGQGIYATYLNQDTTYGASAPCLVANNQIMGSNGTVRYGIYRSYGQWNFINNSIYLEGTGNIYGLNMAAITTANTGYFYGYNNIVIANGTGANNYPVYASNANYISLNVYLDYNAYYSSNNTIAYAGGAITTLANWQSTHKQDTHSVYMLPLFSNPSIDLSLADYDPKLICDRNDKVTHDILNDQRTILTIMGAYSTPLYEGYDLSVDKFVEPMEGVVECFPEFTPIKISLYNQGTYTVDFSQYPVTLHFSCESDSVNVQNSIVINTNSLLAMNRSTYEVYPLLDIANAGMYKLKVWIECDAIVNEQAFNDTLLLNYYVEKSILPYDNDFSWVGAGIAISQTYGNINWAITENTPVQPVFGDKSMMFASSISKGSICQAMFPSVHLQGTYHPRLQFWYVHDDANPKLRDHMDVKISTDGGATFTLLQTIYRYDQAYTTPTWIPYQIDLANYTQGTCIIITFTAYSYGGGDQAIDRIRIVAAQDMQLTMLPPDFASFTACDLDNKAISVVMENMTNQPIPYHDGDSITIDISGANSRTIKYPLKGHATGKLEGFEIDTIEIVTDIDFSISGTYDITAYTNAIDSIQSNDTDRVSFTFLADVAVNEILSIEGKEVGDTVYPTVKIMNKGTLPIYSPFDIIFYVNGKDTVSETITDIMEVGDSLEYTFDNYFIVPPATSVQPYYVLIVETTLSCDGQANNNKKQYIGNVDYVDLSISAINYPTAETYLEKGTEVFVEADIYNKGSFDSDGVKIFVEVESEGVVVVAFSETTEPISSETIITHTFKTSYQVPTLSSDSMPYYVKVFIEATDEDIDLQNDTIRLETYALNDVSIASAKDINWALGQNVPNPAQTFTEIPYSIPQDGTINVKIVSVSGQVLYQKEMQSVQGNHTLLVDIDFLANGIYYYSMEYEGRTIVKKMTIQK